MILRREAGGEGVEGGVWLQPVGGRVAPHFWAGKAVEGAAAAAAAGGDGGRTASGRDHGRFGKALQKIFLIDKDDRSEFRGGGGGIY
jgi:hypothetical protein